MTRIKFLFDRTERLAFLSHLDLVRLFIRALRRAHLPLAYSQGFNPHPRLALALPLPLGVLAENEPGELYFVEQVKAEEFKKELGSHLPEGVCLKQAFTAALDEPALASQVEAALYRAELRELPEIASQWNEQQVSRALSRMLKKEEILAPRRGKKNKTGYKNVRPGIIRAEIVKNNSGPAAVELYLKAGSRGGVSPFFLLEQLANETGNVSLSGECWRLYRQGLYRSDGKLLMTLPEGM